jgi:uncharacterized protein
MCINKGETMSESENRSTALQDVIARLAAGYRPQKIILFGSQAYGKQEADSDIDLLIIKESQATPYERAIEMRRILRDPERRIPIDFIIVTPAELQERLQRGDQFLEEILNQGKVIYAA